MTNRSVSVSETKRRILVSTVEEFWDSPTPDLRLQTIASRASVTVQTILRQFKSRENLLLEATKYEADQIRAVRDPKSVDSLESAVHQLVDHYEVMGDRVLRLLAEETRLPSLSQIVATGRKVHRRWCREVFTETLRALPVADRTVRLAQLVAICDIYTWKILRRDSGLSARATKNALVSMLKPLTKDE
ncbi:MAG: TetR/AcrR family transcriptional regulator [Mariniphaga sp.]